MLIFSYFVYIVHIKKAEHIYSNKCYDCKHNAFQQRDTAFTCFYKKNHYWVCMEELKKALKTTGKYIQILEQNGIHTIADLLQYFPRSYEDRANIQDLNNIVVDGQTTVSTKGKIIEKKFSPRWGKKVYEIIFEDLQGTQGIINFYNAGYKVKTLQKEQRYIIIGKPSHFKGKIIFRQPDCIPASTPEQEENMHNVGRLYPIYSELQGINPSWFAKKIRSLKEHIDTAFTEIYPPEFLKLFHIMEIKNTVRNMHYPETYEDKEKALYRVFFDRLLRIQLFSQITKDTYQSVSHPNNKKVNRDIIKNIVQTLPFTLTQAQKKVIKQMIENVHIPKPMLQLLQWDVGSGKTIVAAIIAFYIIHYCKGQVLFIAPLEILAQQHYKSMAKILLPLGIKIGLLTWSISKKEKDSIKKKIENWTIDIVIGTHAILQENVICKNLQLAIIDEQHKFGVKQRWFFKRYNNPHIIQMSATPIPRSMALAFFGEFEVSTIDQMPVWRKPIISKIISEAEQKKLKPRIMTKINQWQKVFIITPLIEESEKLENVKAAIQEFEEIQDTYPEIRNKIGIIHGKMKAQEKDAIMEAFKKGKIMILVATTVIEVGVDIPEATVMIIKNAERFGLSQLHQLRWRIGRSDLQSYCFLETKKKSSENYKRLKALEQTSDGFKLAELDLQYRWPGELLGTRQSGIADIPLSMITNIKFLETIQKAAKRLLEKYPNLDGIPELKKHLTDKLGDIIA